MKSLRCVDSLRLEPLLSQRIELNGRDEEVSVPPK